MRIRRFIAQVGMVGVFMLFVSPAWAAKNNGFDTDWVYTAKDADGENVRAFQESDPHARMWDATTGEHWDSLTFAGTLNNDARLFVSRTVGGFGGSEIEIAELNAAGNVVNSAHLSSIIGGPTGASIDHGNLRYSAFHNSLFVAYNDDVTVHTTARAYQIDLGLSDLIHTYQGPQILDRRLNVDINSGDGTLYMTNRHINGSSDLGDLIAFDTSGPAGGTTSVFNVLVDGDTFATDGAVDHDRWRDPSSAVYRKGTTSDDDTVVVFINSSANPRNQMEFYLDTIAHPPDANGNLAFRGTLPKVGRGWNGQQDDKTGEIWLGAIRQGLFGDLPDDSLLGVEPDRGYLDADSPAFFSIPSDLTGDGFVDFDDLTILLAFWDEDVGAGQGNLIDPLTTRINFQDLTFLLADWTGPGPAGSPEAALGEEAVPEPSSLFLLAIATLGLSIYRRRRRRAF